MQVRPSYAESGTHVHISTVKRVQHRAALVAAMKTRIITKTVVGFGNAGLPPGSLQMNDYLMQGTLPVAKVILLTLSDLQTNCLFLHAHKDKKEKKRLCLLASIY